MDVGHLVAVLGAAVVVAAADPTVVITGDSYASGNGAGDYSNVACMQSPHSGQEALEELSGLDVTNVACTAAHLDHILEERLVDRWMVPADSISSGTPTPDREEVCGEPPVGGRVELSVTGAGADATGECSILLSPQIDTFAGADAVFLTIGGNDLGFGQVAYRCFAVPHAGRCREEISVARAGVDELMVEYGSVLGEIRSRYPDLDIFLVPYPPLVSGSVDVDGYDAGADMVALQDEISEGVSELAASAAARLGGVYLVDDLESLWVSGAGAGEEMLRTAGAIEILHPTPAGWRVIGQSYLLSLGRVYAADR